MGIYETAISHLSYGRQSNQGISFGCKDLTFRIEPVRLKHVSFELLERPRGAYIVVHAGYILSRLHVEVPQSTPIRLSALSIRIGKETDAHFAHGINHRLEWTRVEAA